VLATLKKFSLYQLLAIIVGAQGAILLFVGGFGSAGADTVAGSVLMGLGVLAFVGHYYFQSIIISVPQTVYQALAWTVGILTTLVTASGMIVQYAGTVAPGLRPWVALILQGAALIASLFSQLFAAQTALAAARAKGVTRRF